MDLLQAVRTYVDAWGETDAAQRAQMLEQVWDEHGVYTDPMAHVEGRAALIGHIGGFQQQFPGARIELSSGVDTHHGKIRFAWRLVLADQTVHVEGIDFGEVSADGKLRAIVGFFGPLTGV